MKPKIYNWNYYDNAALPYSMLCNNPTLCINICVVQRHMWRKLSYFKGKTEAQSQLQQMFPFHLPWKFAYFLALKSFKTEFIDHYRAPLDRNVFIVYFPHFQKNKSRVMWSSLINFWMAAPFFMKLESFNQPISMCVLPYCC